MHGVAGWWGGPIPFDRMKLGYVERGISDRTGLDRTGLDYDWNEGRGIIGDRRDVSFPFAPFEMDLGGTGIAMYHIV